MDKSLGLFASLADTIAGSERAMRGGMPDFSSATTLFVLSDYSGDHRGAGYEVLSFLVFDPRSIGTWHQVWEPARRAYLRDGRRMAFKSLSDGRRRHAMPAFLHAADQLDGLLLTLSLNRRLPPLFEDGEYPPTVEGLEQLRLWKRKPYLKMLTAVNIVSVLIAGLSHPGQDIFWYSDEDDLAASPRRLCDLCNVFARVSSHYLQHSLRHFRFGTSKSDDGSKILEDLLAIPDIAAGSVSDIFTNYLLDATAPAQTIMTPIPHSTTWKAAGMVPWLADNTMRLKRVVISLEPTGQGEEKCFRRWTFHAVHQEPVILTP
ncbi:MAG TPA: hypothetical protein VKA21_15110 [Candidatus Binatia bacterium]|nr:hypothetical protein [Candidatus Binatia bacterium]